MTARVMTLSAEFILSRHIRVLANGMLWFVPAFYIVMHRFRMVTLIMPPMTGVYTTGLKWLCVPNIRLIRKNVLQKNSRGTASAVSSMSRA